MPIYPLIALKPHTYAGQRIRVGQEYEARTHSDAMTLTLLKVAKSVPSSSNGPVPTPEPVAIQVEDAPIPLNNLVVDAGSPLPEPEDDVVQPDTVAPVRAKRTHTRRTKQATE